MKKWRWLLQTTLGSFFAVKGNREMENHLEGGVGSNKDF